MRSVRRRNTTPELTVRRLLHKMGYRFRLHPKGMPGTPDVVLPKWRTAIFVHGCFWHGHTCRLGKLPATRTDYWIPKIAENRHRDEAKLAQLTKLGWNVITVWQCDIRDEAKLMVFLSARLCANGLKTGIVPTRECPRSRPGQPVRQRTPKSDVRRRQSTWRDASSSKPRQEG